MKKFIIILLGMITLPFVIKAQDSPAKFGKITEEELNAKVCPIDSNAHAYYIFDCGEVRFTYPQTIVRSDDPTSNNGFRMESRRHLRIKILDETAYDLANIQIPLYVSGSEEEKIIDIDGVSVNIDNGKSVKTKFEKKNLIIEQVSKDWKLVKVPMPNVKAGTVIDVKYAVSSQFYFNLRNWQFQYSIPVMYSKYVSVIPEYFNYHRNIKGYVPITVENKQKRNSITLTYQEKEYSLNSSGNVQYSNTFDYSESEDTYLGTNIPAFNDDAYLRAVKNYLTEVEFELSYTKFPNSPINSITTSWNDVIKDILDDAGLGRKLKRTDFLDDFVNTISIQNLSKQDLISIAVKHINSRIKWNEKDIYTTTSLKKTYEEGIGSSIDINLCLVGLLRKFGIESYPVFLSTQKNGMLRLTHPSISDFNYMITMANVDGNIILVDPTEPLLQLNQLPIRCLNDNGLVVKEGSIEWVDLMKGASYKSQASFFMQMDSSYTLNGQYFNRLDNHAAYLERLDIRSKNSTDKYVEEFQNSVPGLIVNSTKISGYDTLNKPLVLDYNISLSNAVETAGDLIFITPFLFETTKQSPFKLEKRSYPVEFDYPTQQMMTAQYEIPENMVLESMPQSAVYTLPDKSAKYTYSATQVGNKVVITSMYSRNKVLYLPEEYGALKEFYRMMIVKQNEKIVLKNK